MDDELLAQPQVMKLLDSLREQYTRYQEVCRQRSKRTQLEEIQQKVMQVSLEPLLNAPRWSFELKSQPVISATIRWESWMPPVTSQMSVCWFHSVLYIVAATVTFQRLFWFVEVVKNVLSCLGAALCCTLAMHGCIAGDANAGIYPAGKERNTFTEHQLCLRVENLPLPMSFKVPVNEDKPLFIPLFI